MSATKTPTSETSESCSLQTRSRPPPPTSRPGRRERRGRVVVEHGQTPGVVTDREPADRLHRDLVEQDVPVVVGVAGDRDVDGELVGTRRYVDEAPDRGVERGGVDDDDPDASGGARRSGDGDGQPRRCAGSSPHRRSVADVDAGQAQRRGGAETVLAPPGVEDEAAGRVVERGSTSIRVIVARSSLLARPCGRSAAAVPPGPRSCRRTRWVGGQTGHRHVGQRQPVAGGIGEATPNVALAAPLGTATRSASEWRR